MIEQVGKKFAETKQIIRDFHREGQLKPEVHMGILGMVEQCESLALDAMRHHLADAQEARQALHDCAPAVLLREVRDVLGKLLQNKP
jgi:hypothetical protein